MPDLETGPYLCTLFSPMEVEREKVEGVWRDVSMLVQPSRSTEDFRSRGRDRTSEIYDDTARLASVRLASLFSHSLTSPGDDWFFLQPIDPNVRSREVDFWIEEAVRVLYSIFRSPDSGFNSAMSEAYLDLASFGTAGVFINGEDKIRFNAMALRELYFATNGLGIIDTVVRKKFWTADQAEGLFGKENLSEGVRSKFEGTQRYTDDTEYLHFVLPIEDVKNDPRLAALPASRKFASVYVDRESKHIVKVGGYDSFPYAVGRFKVSSGELYGSCPATDTIDTIRLTQAISKALLVSATKAADPTVVVEDNSVLGKLRTNPGGVVTVRRGSKLDTLPTGDSRDAFVYLQDERIIIREAFFNDIDQVPDRDRMTATEVIEHRRDKLQRVSPFSNRIQEEIIGRIISRTIDLAIEKGAIPRIPKKLAESGLKVEYISPLAMSQQSSRIQSVQMWVNSLLPLIQIDPNVALSINTQEMAVYNAESLNVPPQLIRPAEEVEAMKQKQEDLATAQALAQTGQQVAETAKTAAEADSIAGRIGA